MDTCWTQTLSTYLLELGASIRLFAFPTFKLHPFDRESFLFRLEIPCTGVLGHVRKKDVTEESDRERDHSIHNEEPLCRMSDHCNGHKYACAKAYLPATEPALAFKVIDSRHQITAEHTREGPRCVEYAASLGQFVSAIPGSDEVLHARVESTFSQSDEESYRI